MASTDAVDEGCGVLVISGTDFYSCRFLFTSRKVRYRLATDRTENSLATLATVA